MTDVHVHGKRASRFVWKGLAAVAFVLALLGCATVPQITKGATNYLQNGSVSATLKGNDFYMAIGDVDLYHRDLFGALKPSGTTVEIAVAIEADKETGEVLKIATLQPSGGGLVDDSAASAQNGMTVASGGRDVLADLQGGISVIDIQPYPRWLDALQAMRDAISKLSTYTDFALSAAPSPTVVAVAPFFPMPIWIFRDGRHDRRGGHR